MKPEILSLRSLGSAFPIKATHFPPRLISSRPTPPAVLIAAATGVPASFYTPYAEHLASLGSPVLTFDYRFSGLSWPAGVNPKDRAEVLKAVGSEEAQGVTIAKEWKSDLEAALGWVVGRYCEREIVVVGHSVGGHLLTLVDESLLRHVTRSLWMGVFSPYFGHSGYEELRREKWREILAQANKIGYFPGRTAGFGNDLPLGVGRQWSGWMEYPTYYAHENMDVLVHYRVPTLSVATTDDLLAEGNPIKTDAILECTPNCPATRVLFDPEVKGWDAVGHVNAFTALHHPAALNGEGIWSFMDRYVLEGKASLVDGEVRDFRGGAVKSEEKL